MYVIEEIYCGDLSDNKRLMPRRFLYDTKAEAVVGIQDFIRLVEAEDNFDHTVEWLAKDICLYIRRKYGSTYSLIYHIVKDK